VIGDCEWLERLKNAPIALDARDANSLIPAQVNENWFVTHSFFTTLAGLYISLALASIPS
jgi:hypothetical protein